LYFHGVIILDGLGEVTNGRPLLANGHIDAVQLLILVLAVVPPLLVEGGVDGNGGFAGLTITNDKEHRWHPRLSNPADILHHLRPVL
jgi:hypothetical protein